MLQPIIICHIDQKYHC